MHSGGINLNSYEIGQAIVLQIWKIHSQCPLQSKLTEEKF